LYLQHAFSLAAGGIGTEALFWVALVLSVLLLGVEIWGIYVLIKKLLPVFRAGRAEHVREDDGTTHKLGGAVLMFGAVPMPLQVVLLIVLISLATGAAVLVSLLVILKIKGYEMAFDDMPAEEEEEIFAASEEEAEEDVEEEPYAPLEAEPEVVTVPAKEAEELPVQPVAIPVYSSAKPEGQMPYVEKHFTETYREVIRETTEKYSPATEAILRAIEELMKVSIQLRTEREMAVANNVAADAPLSPEPDDDGDETDDTAEDELDAREDAGEGESDLFSANERIVGFDEDTGCYIVAHYRKSLEAKLIQARPEVKKYYSEIKNALLSYEGTTDRMTWSLNTFVNDRTPVARINVRTQALDLYLALDPATLEDSVYRGRDVGEKKKYADTPFLFRVNSPRKLTLALELVQRAAEEMGLAPIDIEAVNYEELYPFDATDALVERGLIREYLREEKPSVSFEPAPEEDVEETHEEAAPLEPVRTETTFSTWELESDEETEAPVPAPVETAETEESAPAYETVKTTERHYTESYYGDPSQAVRLASERTYVTKHPIEVITATEDELADAEEPVKEAPVTEATSAEELAEEASAAEEPFDATEETGEASEEESEEEPMEDAEEELLPADEALAAMAVLTPEETEESLEEDAETPNEETLLWSSFEGVIKDIFAEESKEEETRAGDERFGTFEIEDEEAAEAEDNADEVPWDEEEPEEEAADAREETEAPEEEPEDVEEEIEDVEEEIEDVEEEPEDVEEEPEDAEEEPEDVEDGGKAVHTAPQAIPANDPTVALIDVCIFDKHFASGETVNLEVLKRAGLVDKQVTKLKLFASGELKGQFTVEAHHFTLDAIMAISAADGDSIMIR